MKGKWNDSVNHETIFWWNYYRWNAIYFIFKYLIFKFLTLSHENTFPTGNIFISVKKKPNQDKVQISL